MMSTEVVTRRRPARLSLGIKPQFSRIGAKFLFLAFVGTLAGCESSPNANTPGLQESPGLVVESPSPVAGLPVNGAPLNIQLNGPANYELGVLREGSSTYIDRDYKVTSVPPEYHGLCYVRTANDDKYSSGSDFLSLRLNKTTSVYVGYDTDTHLAVPEWLEGWVDTGNELATTDSNKNLRLYKKAFAAGSAQLGGNEMGGSMYVVLLEDDDPESRVPCDIVSEKTIAISWLPVSEPVVGYRVYYGASKSTASTIVQNIALSSEKIDPQAPSIQYSAWQDLGQSSGKNICFRISAYNETMESELSSPMCAMV